MKAFPIVLATAMYFGLSFATYNQNVIPAKSD